MPSISTTVGAKRDIAKTYSAPITVSAITNAASAVATLAAGHLVEAGDYVELRSAWGEADHKVVLVSAVDVNDVTLSGLDTSDTGEFPAGQGAGTLRRITAWDRIENAKENNVSGGERQWLTQAVDGAKRETKIPSISAATTVAMEIYDDTSMPWYATALAASRSGAPAAYRITLKGGQIAVVSAYWAVNETPDHGKNKEVVTKVDLAYLNTPQRYAAA